MRKVYLFIFSATLVFVSAAYGKAVKQWTVATGLDSPESAYFEPKSKTIFVSSISGAGTAKDGKGWISQVSLEGKLIAEKWSKTILHAPKGLRSFKSTLWVTDIDRVVALDLKNGKQKSVVAIKGAIFLNDVAVAKNGDVYVSDMLDGKIYRIRGGKHELFVSGSEFESPNGLLVKEPYLRVAGWGMDTKSDFSTKSPGSLYNINLKTRKKSPILDPLGALDGIEALAAGFAVSDWKKGVVYRTGKNPKPVETMVSGLKGAADIGYVPSRRMLLVPEMGENKLHAYRVSW